jgi:predicted Zn-dependent protease
LALLSACSSTGLNISSNPEGAEVTNLQGELIGKTPLTLSSEQLAKVSDNGLLNFKVSAPGHLPRLVYADGGVAREISVALPKSEAGSFKSEFTRDFGQDMNQMLRSAFVIQKLVGSRNFSEAAKEIEAFKKEYPSLAYGHVISAHLALAQGKREEARASLSRARALDPKDPDINQSLKLLSAQPQGGSP